MGEKNPKKVCVIVLGDIGRSPRMQYHSLSLANKGYKVDIIGYEESKINSTVIQNENIYIHPLIPFASSPISFLNNDNFPKAINYIFKTIWQIITLMCALIFKNADYVLVQNPPAVPTLFCCTLYSFIFRAEFIIDWHNYAYSIMMLTNTETSLFVKLTRVNEWYFGSWAKHNLCVTKSMKEDLHKTWNIEATVLYDRPPDIFKPIDLKTKHEFLLRLAEQYKAFKGERENETVFTFEENGDAKLKNNRPALMISSTSWTEDEDFSILLNALQNYEKLIQDGNPRNLPDAICVITGKGPLKDFYLKKIQSLKMKHVKIICPWLDAEDYPLLLASADLGLCLHTSSSGLDLPMKVVDMFGCCLPVCAIDFQCLNELVKNGENSYTFTNTTELSEHLSNWFDNFPNNKEQQIIESKFKKELHKFQQLRWEENWETNAFPLFN